MKIENKSKLTILTLSLKSRHSIGLTDEIMLIMQVVDKRNFLNVLEKFYSCIEKPILIIN
jgi:hypothetical protein